MTEISTRLRHLIIAARKSRGMTRAEIAERMKCSKSRIGNIESGRTAITCEYLDELCKILGLPSSTFIAGDAQLYPLTLDEFERSLHHAQTIRFYTNNLIPLPLQNESYLRVIAYEHPPQLKLSKEESLLLVRRKLRLQEALGKKCVESIIHKSALYEQIGGARTMIDQIQYMRSTQQDYSIIDPTRSTQAPSFFNYILFDNHLTATELPYATLQTDRADYIKDVNVNWECLINSCVSNAQKQNILDSALEYWQDQARLSSPFFVGNTDDRGFIRKN